MIRNAAILVAAADETSVTNLRLLSWEGHNVTVVDIVPRALDGPTEWPYRTARPADEAFQVLTDEASKGWRDRHLVDAFC